MDSNLSNKGFSLVELIIAIGLVAVLTAIAIPNLMQSLPKYRLQSAARDLYSNMQKAKMNAVMESREWGIIFNSANNTYQMCFANGAGLPDWPNETNITCVETFDLAAYGSGIRFGNPLDPSWAPISVNPTNGISYQNGLVRFSPRGLARNAGYCYLVNQRMDLNLAVGTPNTVSGSIRLRKWLGGGTWE